MLNRAKTTTTFSLLAVLLMPGLATAASPAEIEQAISRGADHLKSTQDPDGGWRFPEYLAKTVGREADLPFTTGATALAALALLESGVATDDPAIEKAEQFVLERAESCAWTYSIALSAMFLDRLERGQSQRRHTPLIVKLGERLRDGQMEGIGGRRLGAGAWTYRCGVKAGLAELSDNSNTQFALYGLWVARRHGADMGDALEKAARHFRDTQAKDGSWPYALGRSNQTSSPAMTCAGLLALATHHGHQTSLRATSQPPSRKRGAKPEPEQSVADPSSDPAIAAGFARLAQSLAGPAAERQPNQPPKQWYPSGFEKLANLNLGTCDDIYFLWSLERVGVIYGVARFGELDWYQWGADALLKSQESDGSWRWNLLDNETSAGTSQALLFLSRANSAPDLTELLAGKAPADGSSEVTTKRRQETPAAAQRGARKATAAKKEQPKAEQRKRLQALLDEKGTEATRALALAILEVDDDLQPLARSLLTKRLTRMTARTLKKYLQTEDDEELRVAAILAVGDKPEPSLRGELVELLQDSNDRVADTAHQALVQLTGKSFGEFKGAAKAERRVVIERWEQWWRQAQD